MGQGASREGRARTPAPRRRIAVNEHRNSAALDIVVDAVHITLTWEEGERLRAELAKQLDARGEKRQNIDGARAKLRA